MRNGSGAFASRTYVAVPADSDRGRAYIGDEARRDAEDTAVRAVQAWLGVRDEDHRRAAVRALRDLGSDGG